jgi:hypothetical protein
MGISTNSRGDSIVTMLAPGSKADTAAATSGWVDIRPYKGEVLIDIAYGAVVGSMAGKIQSATDSGGTGAADITGATFANVSTSNGGATIAVPKSAGKYIRFVGTVTTGPIALSVTMRAHPGSV